MLYGIVNGSSRNVFFANAAQRNRYTALTSSTPSADGYLPWTVLTESVPLGSLSENSVSSFLLMSSSITIPKEQMGKECAKRSWRFEPADWSM
jgi:hypothetical protein